MTSHDVVRTFRVGNGVHMEMIIDHTAPEDSVERLALDTIYDGEPGSDVFQVPPHWHKYHSEHMTVLEGRAAITLDGKTQIVQAGDPTVFIPARHTHSMKGFEGEKLVLRERPDPAGLYKAEFFNDIFSEGKFPGFWHTMRSFYDHDTYVPLPGNIGVLDEAFILVVGGLAKLIAPAKAKL